MTTKQRIFEALADCDFETVRDQLYPLRDVSEIVRKSWRLSQNVVCGKIDHMTAAIKIKILLWSEVLP